MEEEEEEEEEGEQREERSLEFLFRQERKWLDFDVPGLPK